MATSRKLRFIAYAAYVGLVVCTAAGCPAYIPLAERQPKPDQRFAYSVNFMPDSPQKRVLVMKYSLFLDRTRLMNTQYERHELARLDVMQDSAALNAFWQTHFADMDPYPTTQRNEWFDDLERAAQFANKQPFDCFHFMAPDPRGVLKDPDDMLDPLGETIARLGAPLSWNVLVSDSGSPIGLTFRFVGDGVFERSFAKESLRYDQWEEIPPPLAEARNESAASKFNSLRAAKMLAAYAKLEMLITKARSAPKVATPYAFEQLRPGDVVIDAIPEPDPARHKYRMRLHWKVNARALTLADNPPVAGLRYHYVINAPDGTVLAERAEVISDTLDTMPDETDALYFSVVSAPFYAMGDPRGNANGQYRLGIDISDFNSDVEARRHTSRIEYFSMDVDRMVPTERAWVIGPEGGPDVYNRLNQGDNVLEFPGHFVSNDSNVAWPEIDPQSGMYECEAILELVRSRGGTGSASSPDEIPILYLPWDNQMTALDSIMTEAARTGRVPKSYRARVPVDPEGATFAWKTLDVPGPVREYLKKELERAGTPNVAAAYRVSTRFSVTRPDSSIQITLPITAIGRPRELQDPAGFVEPGDYNLIGYIWPADGAERYSPFTSKKNAMLIPYQRIRVPVRIRP